MMSVPTPKILRRMRFVYCFPVVVVGILLLVSCYKIFNSPPEQWESSLQMVFSSAALIIALFVLLLSHGYSAKLLEQVENQLGVANEQLNLMKRQLSIASQQLEVSKRQLAGLIPANSD